MRLLLTIDSSEWDGGSRSWKRLEDRNLSYPYARPTDVGTVLSHPGRENHVPYREQD
ncbi:hypothetical protein AB0G79_14680 [Streptomyces sp. NPDC020807]|uniref:hypothetical protein n=1 Tax=Streptomyces sp. NPDC020807 TaxID=3155119 RepID=UPI0033FF3041